MSQKKQFVCDIHFAGQVVDDVFRVLEHEVRNSDCGPYLHVRLQDRTGVITGKRFNIGNYLPEKLLRYARIKGQVENYRGRLCLKDVYVLPYGGDVDAADFEAVSSLSYTELSTRFDELVKSITEPYLMELLSAIFTQDTWADYSLYPAALEVHHATKHGLLQHSIEVTESALAIADVYSKTGGRFVPDISLVVAGALLHDIGKIFEFDRADDGTWLMTKPGILEGHVTLGSRLVASHIAAINGFPPDLEYNLLHIVASHHGRREFGSPVEPMTIEARIVASADEISAKLFVMNDARSRAGDELTVKSINGRVYTGPTGTGAPIDPYDDDIADAPFGEPSAHIQEASHAS